MVTRNKSGRKQTKAKEQLIILAVHDKASGLNPRELRTLKKALQAAAEASIESHERMKAVVVAVSEGR